MVDLPSLKVFQSSCLTHSTNPRSVCFRGILSLVILLAQRCLHEGAGRVAHGALHPVLHPSVTRASLDTVRSPQAAYRSSLHFTSEGQPLDMPGGFCTDLSSSPHRRVACDCGSPPPTPASRGFRSCGATRLIHRPSVSTSHRRAHSSSSSLSMPGDTDLPTRVEDWARGTLRQSRSADVFAEWNEQTIDLNPQPFRQFDLKVPHGLFGRRC